MHASIVEQGLPVQHVYKNENEIEVVTEPAEI